VPREAVALCADLEHNVYNATHTDPRVVAALQDTYWYELDEWSRSGPHVTSGHG
jgi:DICT domain-containing protein